MNSPLPPDVRALIDEAWAEIDRQADRIALLSEAFMRDPETGYHETRTSDRVAAEMASLGLEVERGLGPTGVKGRQSGRSSERTVGVLGELDALVISDHPYANPVTGAAHACGHNAQLASMLGAAMGLSAVADRLDGDIAYVAVPAEECIEVGERIERIDAGEIGYIVGKAELIAKGHFDDIDLAMMTHTSNVGPDGPLMTSEVKANGCVVKLVSYRGVSSHAGSAPWLGVNALKAAMLGLSAIDAQRETFPPDDGIRVSAVITKGGESVSAVPAAVDVEIMVRGRSAEAVSRTSEQVDRALRAGAIAFGAGVDIRTVGAYHPMVPDAPLVEVADRHARELLGDDRVARGGHWMGGSTDMGDLGMIMPIAHPLVAAGNSQPTHGPGFWTVDHAMASVTPAKVMAATVIELLADGAAGAARVIERSGPKLSRDEYVRRRDLLDRTISIEVGSDG